MLQWSLCKEIVLLFTKRSSKAGFITGFFVLVFLVIISGLDECGRGSLAGPLVGALAIIHCEIEEFLTRLNTPLRDSKKLTEKQRLSIYHLKDHLPITYAIESISVEDINAKGIAWANQEVFLRLVNRVQSDHYLIDGNLKFTDPRVESVIKGDNLHPQIMLASVIAKVYRDQLMSDLHNLYPQYSWHQNSGYGSTAHQMAIKEHGPTLHHRTLFIRRFV